MLYIGRKLGESVIINDDIKVTVIDIKGKSVKLGILYPEHAQVHREEVYDRIRAENRSAAFSADAFLNYKDTFNDTTV